MPSAFSEELLAASRAQQGAASRVAGDGQDPVGVPVSVEITPRGQRIIDAQLEPELEAAAPLVVAIVDGGLVQYEYLVAGTGVPEFIVLDMDREGSDDDDLRSFLEYAGETADRLAALGEDPTDIRHDIDRLKVVLLDE